MSVIRRSPPADHTGLNALSAEQLRAKVLTADAMYRAQSRKVEALTEQLQGAVRALEAVRDYAGRVCDEYETCDHSHAAWQIANRYLTGGQ